MKHDARPMRPRIVSSTLALLLAFAAYALPAAQSSVRKPLTIDDYAKWRSIVGAEISGDGKWVAYTLQLANTIPAESKPVLHLKNLETNEEITVEHASISRSRSRCRPMASTRRRRVITSW